MVDRSQFQKRVQGIEGLSIEEEELKREPTHGRHEDGHIILGKQESGNYTAQFPIDHLNMLIPYWSIAIFKADPHTIPRVRRTVRITFYPVDRHSKVPYWVEGYPDEFGLTRHSQTWGNPHLRNF